MNMDPREILIYGRSSDWQRRSDKWHNIKVRERRWDWSGAAVPPAIYAIGVLIIALGVGAPALVSAGAGLVASLFGVRAYIARQELNVGKAHEAWANADRMAEAYKGIIARLKAGENLSELLLVSDKLESTGRFGLSEDVSKGLQAAVAMFPVQGVQQ